ncbi:hypothetical protein [Amorphus sp. MBR-141]
MSKKAWASLNTGHCLTMVRANWDGWVGDVVACVWADDDHDEKATARLIAAAPDLARELQECRTDLMIAASNADHAAKTDSRWEGVGDKLRIRVKAADALLSALEGGEHG